jgi:hypothetical protein
MKRGCSAGAARRGGRGAGGICDAQRLVPPGRVRILRGERRDVSGYYGGRDEACPLRTRWGREGACSMIDGSCRSSPSVSSEPCVACVVCACSPRSASWNTSENHFRRTCAPRQSHPEGGAATPFVARARPTRGVVKRNEKRMQRAERVAPGRAGQTAASRCAMMRRQPRSASIDASRITWTGGVG